MAKPTRDSAPTLLVTELWGLGDLALAIPFLRAASGAMRVTLVAKPHAEPLIARFAPKVELVSLVAPWTAFSAKYQLLRWPWGRLQGTIGALRQRSFDFGVSARSDPRDHALLLLAGARTRIGFPRVGSAVLLNHRLPAPANPHRAERWKALARDLGGFDYPAPAPGLPAGRRLAVIHTGAGHRVRRWPGDRFEVIARRCRESGWDVDVIDDSLVDLDTLLARLAQARCFIGNDSGPGHLAALMGIPTFTLYGPQLPELFAPVHPRSAGIEGGPCAYKPCFDHCRFAEPNCILSVDTESAWERVKAWMDGLETDGGVDP